MINYIEKYPILSLVVFVVLMLGFTIDAVPVSIMEARNFISAREMLTDNNWILTTMNGEARYEKPPLPTWITAAFGFVFGMKSVLALRWPALLFMASIGVSTYLLSKRLQLRKSHCLINGFIGLTSFYIIGITIEAPWDIYTHAFMLMALFQLFIILKEGKATIIRSLLFVLFIAGSILSKGPVSLYVLFLPFLIAFGIAYRYKGNILFFLKLLSLLIFAIVLGGWWYMHVRVADPDTFLKIAERETSNWSSYNVRPFYYYWSFFVQSGIWTIVAFVSLLYPYLKSRVVNLKAYRFSFFWTIFAVILLSVIPEKKSRYLMPVLIPLAINMGFYIDFLIREFRNLTSKKDTFPVYFQFVLISSIALILPIAIAIFVNPFNELQLIIRWVLLCASLLFIAFGIFKYLKAKQIKSVFYLVILFMLAIGLLGLPFISSQIQDHYKPVSRLQASNLSLYSLDYAAPEVIYNYGNKIPELKNKDGITLPMEKEFYLLTYKNNPESEEDLSKLYHIEYIETYDLNFSSEGTRGHKNRLVNKLYKLTRK